MGLNSLQLHIKIAIKYILLQFQSRNPNRIIIIPKLTKKNSLKNKTTLANLYFTVY